MVKVFLDIDPITNGHVLIVPKKHILNYIDMDDNTLLHIYSIIKKLYPLFEEKIHCSGLTLMNNAFNAQEVKHYHMHFIPRYPNDKVHFDSNEEILENIQIIKDKLVK